MLVNTIKVRAENCDYVLHQYSNFLDRVPVGGSGIFSSFNPNIHWVDEFFFTHMTGKKFVALLFDKVKNLLVLSHGQASVERGFCVNKEIDIENLREHSLAAQCTICDCVGLGRNYLLQLLHYNRNMRSFYMTKGAKKRYE